MQTPAAHPSRPLYGERVVVALALISCLITAANWTFWNQRDVRGITGGVGMVFGLALLLIAIYDFARRRRLLSFVAVVLASVAAAYWIFTVWRAVTPIAG